MLAKKYRLDARARLQNAQTYASPLFTLRLNSTSNERSRIGIVVSKKVDKRATVRNRVRRRLSASIEELLPKFKKAVDMRFFVKLQAAESSKKELFQEVQTQLQRAEVI